MLPSYYTIEQIEKFPFTDYNYLPEETIMAIKQLDFLQQSVVQMRAPSNINKKKTNTDFATGDYPTVGQKKYSSNQQYQKSFNKSIGGTTPVNKRETDKQWIKQEKLKATIIEKKEGIQKLINDIRAILNKLSEQKYEIQLQSIIELIDSTQQNIPLTSSLSEDEDDETAPIKILEIDTRHEDLNLIANSIFDTIIQNQGLFKNPILLNLYTNLYIDLQMKYPSVFNQILNNFFENIKGTIESIVYYDSAVNYDEFCNYNKLNEIRKSNNSFIALLVNKNILHIDIICDILQYFQKKFDEYLIIPNKSNELEQIADNIFILVTQTYTQMKHHPLWLNEIFEKIQKISNEKPIINYPSLTYKIIFRYKDIIDFIRKQ
jgi:hypothetical protein